MSVSKQIVVRLKKSRQNFNRIFYKFTKDLDTM